MKRSVAIFSALVRTSLKAASTGKKKFHVCTVATVNKEKLQQLLFSAARNLIDIDVLGMWLPFKGTGQKLTYIKNYVKNLQDDDIVLFVDAYDVLILATARVILQKFAKMETECVFGAEANLSFQKQLEPYFKSPSKFKYLNSGTFMGYAGFLKTMLNEIPIDEVKDDQSQLMLYYVEHMDRIKLDTNCELFFPLAKVTPDEFRIDKIDKTVECLLTGTKPCIIHGNSLKGKAIYQAIYRAFFETKKT